VVLRYSEAFIEQALVKVYSRGERTVRSVADELNINCHTVKNWMKRKVASKVGASVSKEKRPKDWSAGQQLEALQETHGLSGETLQAWCREKGIFPYHLTRWKTAFCAGGKAQPEAREFRVLKNETLKCELFRKDKALAEAAALLVLQKKFRARWEDAVK